MTFRGILISSFILLSCGYGEQEEPMNLTRTYISELQTSTNAIGSFAGDRLPNLQQEDLEPGEYTIQFQVVEPPTDNLGFATYAYIVWKIDGQQISRIISVFNGSAISGVANSVHVQLQDQSGRGANSLSGTFGVTNGSPVFTATAPQTLKSGQLIQFSNQPNIFYTVPNGVNGTTGILDTPFTGATNGIVTAFALSKYKVAVTLSKGTRAPTMQPAVLSTINAAIAVNSSAQAVAQLPDGDAGVCSILVSATVQGINSQAEADNGNVELINATGNAIAWFIPTRFPFWYPVPPGTAKIQFNNNSTTQKLFFSYQWGIEG